MISRRTLLALAAGTLLVRTASAQSPAKRHRVGILGVGANPRSAPFYVAFERRLYQLGYVEDENLVIDFLKPDRPDTLTRTARELVRHRPDAILAAGPEASVQALRQTTSTVPIVIVALNYDPVAKGYVASLARPGGNITGIFARTLEISAKQLELLREALPQATRLAMLWEATSADQAESAEAAARLLGVALSKIELTPPYDFDRALAKVVRARASGLLVLGSPVIYRERLRISALALKHRLPTIAAPDFAVAGMLLGYGVDLSDAFGRAAEYVDRILKGSSPADLPVEQSTKFEVVVNQKTARALGVTLPPGLLARVDRVVE